MKYVILDQNGVEVPIIFSELQSHSDVVFQRRNSVVSAGFCHFYITKYDDGSAKVSVACWGKSIGLGLASRGKQDEELILRHNEA